MLQSTPLSLRFSIDDQRIETSSQYADARPHADLFITTLPSLDLEITSAYLGSGDFDWIPATHKVADPELGNMVEHDRLEVTAPSDPLPGSTGQLLYDHLAFVQGEVRERRGVRLAIDVGDEDFLSLQLVAARTLEG